MNLLNRTGIQKNTNHCLTKHVSALQTAPDLNLDVATVQDPYMICGTSYWTWAAYFEECGVFFPPHDNIDNLINEFLNYHFNRGLTLLTGDFNCRSRLCVTRLKMIR
ncbi:hypothetical protein AVEN_56716-1 [Araneus ventricosus]|uniref:Endonuclease/exonuclease/phosphatase domain-containing protein n=1 Tax=Araneus ventricosus TaxID=182803 RepID=A0A4Y2WF27_ARAVE|nr:hypothetical protein AVEN_56716-1 [Araneus ventricosus]